jgi:DnaJ-class molecular chaperone
MNNDYQIAWWFTPAYVEPDISEVDRCPLCDGTGEMRECVRCSGCHGHGRRLDVDQEVDL